jgi:hypothetical protein
MNGHFDVKTWGRVTYPISISVHGIHGRAKLFMTVKQAQELVDKLKDAIKSCE